MARRKGLGKLAITDHNSIKGALLAKILAPDLIVVGEEILTTKGEILALFVTKQVPARLQPMEAIDLLRQQGAFISVSHPFDRRRYGWELEELEKIAPYVDALEVFNARCGRALMNREALKFASSHKLLGTAGSDAHILSEVGHAHLLIPDFSNADEFRQRIASAEARGRLSGLRVHLGSRLAWMRHQMAARRKQNIDGKKT